MRRTEPHRSPHSPPGAGVFRLGGAAGGPPWAVWTAAGGYRFAAPASGTLPAPFLRGRAVIAEGDSESRQRLARLASDLGYLPELASDGAEALEALSRGLAPGLIILDAGLPGMSSAHLLSVVSTQGGLHGVPVVALTCADEERQTYSRLGAEAVLVRPVNDATLEAVLRQLTRGRVGRSRDGEFLDRSGCDGDHPGH